MHLSFRRPTLAAVVAAATIAIGPSAHAQSCDAVAGNLVLNCGFESGYDNWSGGGIGLGGGEFYAHSGAAGLQGGSVYAPGFLSQSIATTVGGAYTVSFWYNSTGAFTNQLVASFGGQTLIDAFNLPAQGWTQYSYVVNATSESSLLSLGIRNDPSWDAIDDVSVTTTASVTATPEPASLALMSTGLMLLGGAAVRRRRRGA